MVDVIFHGREMYPAMLIKFFHFPLKCYFTYKLSGFSSCPCRAEKNVSILRVRTNRMHYLL